MARGKHKDHLIMGVAKHYWWYKIEPFYLSCSRYNGVNCDIVAFYKDLSRFTLDRLHACGIHTVEIPDRFEKQGPIDYRYALYIELLKKRGANYNQVLFCDTRDVFFQGSIFPDETTEPYLGVAVEEGRICDDEWNDRWMRERFGKEAYEELKNNKVLCAGTIWGSSETVHEFCNAMIDNLSDPQFNFIDINDQTSLQYMVYKGIVPKNAAVKKSDLDSGKVVTIGTTDNFDISEGVLCCGNASNRPSLVHQWDRHKRLRPFVRKYYTDYHPWINWKRYHDYLSLKDIALTSYHDHHWFNMMIATALYLLAKKPKGERLWK